MGSKINIKEYFEKGVFLIPEYQRGYKWSVKDSKTNESSVEYFVKSLKETFQNRPKEKYFIEAVTTVEEGKKTILVDGQQRTTTLFLLFSALGDNNFIKNKLEYNVRKDSHDWLNNNLLESASSSHEVDSQDIFYFKEAINQIRNILDDTLVIEDFLWFIKNKVFLLYNVIPKDKAINTFIALNGLKAVMKDEELIKSDLLIKSSRIQTQIYQNEEQQFGIEWKINEDRGRLARNWDKWLYWWNQNEVKEYFGTGNHHPLYYLLITYWNINEENKKSKDFSFDNFKSQFISDGVSAKKHFEGLRKLQKTFEDLYNDWETYNLLGLALSFNEKINRENTILFFIKNLKNFNTISDFVKRKLVGSTLSDIENKEQTNSYKDYVEQLKSDLQNPMLYNEEGKTQAYVQLLRMNVLQMNSRKFDFEIFKTKSLEHICPQNPNETNKEFIVSKDEINENSDGINSIGNLVLLNGSSNSSLSNHPLDIKKQKLFDKIKEGFLLPHTLKVFSKSFIVNTDVENLFDTHKYWTSEDVKRNKQYFFKNFDSYYGN